MYEPNYISLKELRKNKNLNKKIERILRRISSYILEYEEEDILLDEIKKGKNSIVYNFTIILFEETANGDDEEELDITSIVKKFYKNKYDNLDKLKKEMIPSIKDKNLLDEGLSPNQFIIICKNINLSLDIFTSYDKEYNEVLLKCFLRLKIRINIEDISELEPGGIDASKIRYHHLCNRTGNREELKKWTKELGIILPKGTKNVMCSLIRDHYGF